MLLGSLQNSMTVGERCYMEGDMFVWAKSPIGVGYVCGWIWME